MGDGSYNVTAWNGFLLLLAFGLSVLLLWLIKDFLLVVLLAAALAAFANPLYQWLLRVTGQRSILCGGNDRK